MNYFTKYRILIGAVILLAAINIAMLATLGFHHIAPKEPQTPLPEPKQQVNQIARELNFTAEQNELFHSLRQTYFLETKENRTALGRNYELIMEELSATNPDKVILNNLAEQIGKLHVEQQQATIDHFLKLQSICSKEQYESLLQHFKHMMGPKQRHRRENMQRNRRFNRANRPGSENNNQID
ncbi:MAG: periplasmic heavy metal sensor [Bacteroidales bacterium]|jgi:Spy/CpxP family protein refolding chaperone|nr:periplasmic heavy metal sensor [Bacteroidales bacterium]MDD3891181.1 periplasmic heavy metal sensor [Bacteroidales bacterium]